MRRTECFFQIIQILRSTSSPADPSLARATRNLVSKLSPAIPKELLPVVLDGSAKPIQTDIKMLEPLDSALLRHAIRERYQLELVYTDRKSRTTNRVAWSLLIAFLNRIRSLVAWRETRNDYRHFKTERAQDVHVLGKTYPGRRAALLKGWEDVVARRTQS